MGQSDRKKVAGGVFWLSLERVIGFSVSFFGGIILARILQPDDFGIVAFATATFLTFSRLCGIGVNQEIVRADAKSPTYRDLLSTYFWLNAGVVSLFFLLISAVIFLSGIFPASQKYVALIIAGGWSVSNLCDPGRSLMQKEMRFKILSFLQWLPGLLGMAVAVLMAYLGYGVWSLCVPQMATLALAGVAALLLSGYKPELRFDYGLAKELLKKSGWYLGNGFCEGAYQRVDDLVVGQLLGKTQLGFYDRAYMLGGMFHHNAGNVISRIIFPLFAKRADENARVCALYTITVRFVLYAAFFVLLPFSIYCPEIITALWGEKWLPAASVFRFMAPYSMLLPAFYISKDVMVSLGLVKNMSKVYFLVLLSVVVLIWPAITLYQLEGAAVAVDLAILMGLMRVGFYLKSHLKNISLTRTFVVPLVIMALLAGLTIAVSKFSLMQGYPLSVNCLLTAAVLTGLSLLVLFTVENTVLRFISDLVQSFFSKDHAHESGAADE